MPGVSSSVAQLGHVFASLVDSPRGPGDTPSPFLALVLLDAASLIRRVQCQPDGLSGSFQGKCDKKRPAKNVSLETLIQELPLTETLSPPGQDMTH